MEGIAAAPPAAKKPKTTTAADAEFLSQFAGTTTSSASSSVGDLHKTNLLNLQVDELVAASRLDYMHVKWHAAAQEYVTAVTSIIEKLPLDQKIAWTEDCPFRRLSDSDDKKSSSKSRLACKPMGCYHAEGLGMMTPASNAKVLPTLDVRVSIPTEGLVETRDYLKDRYFDVRVTYKQSISFNAIAY